MGVAKRREIATAWAQAQASAKIVEAEAKARAEIVEARARKEIAEARTGALLSQYAVSSVEFDTQVLYINSR